MNKLIEVYIPIGTAGCGKSTYYQQLLAKLNEKGTILSRISADDIRFREYDYDHTGKDYDEQDEPRIWGLVYQEFEELLKNPETQVIYFDCTNTTIKRTKPNYHSSVKIHPKIRDWNQEP